jgi:hypothetical protein
MSRQKYLQLSNRLPRPAPSWLGRVAVVGDCVRKHMCFAAACSEQHVITRCLQICAHVTFAQKIS